VESWSFLTNHARVLLCIADDPGVRLRDIAARVGITERSAYGIVNDLTAAGYIVKRKEGRRNRYQIQAHMPLPEPTSQEPAIGEVLALLAGADMRQHLTGTEPARWAAGEAQLTVSGSTATQPGERSWTQRPAPDGRSSGFSREGTDGA